MAEPKAGSFVDPLADPSLGLDDFRTTGLGSLSDFGYELEDEPGEGSKGITRGVQRAKSAFARTGEVLAREFNFPNVEEFFGGVADRANESAAANAPRVPTFDGVDNIQDAYDYVAGLFGEQAVNLPITALATYLGSRVGVRANPADKVLGAMIGGSAGAALPSYVQNFGEIYNEQRDAGIDDPGTAAKYAIPVAALDVIGPGLFAGFLTEGVKKPTKAGVKKVLKNMLTGAGLGAAQEAPTEAAQEYLQIQARRAVDATFQPTEEEIKSRLSNAAIAGGIVGFGFGSVGGAARGVLGDSDSRGLVDGSGSLPESVRLDGSKDTEARDSGGDRPLPSAPSVNPVQLDEELKQAFPDISSASDPLPLIDSVDQIGRGEPPVNFADADRELAERPEEFVSAALKSRVSELAAELTLLSAEAKKPKGQRRSEADLQATRLGLEAGITKLEDQIKQLDDRAKSRKFLQNVPEYAPKSRLKSGTLLEVSRAPARTQEQTAALAEQAKANDVLLSAEQAKALRMSQQASSIASKEPVAIAPPDRAKLRQRYENRTGAESTEFKRAEAEKRTQALVGELVADGAMADKTGKTVASVLRKGLEKVRTLPAEKQEAALRNFAEVAFKGKKLTKEDRQAVINRFVSEQSQILAPQETPEVRPLWSNKPEWLAGIPETATQGGLFDDTTGNRLDGEATIAFNHYGNVPGGVTDPNMIGKGVRGADQKIAKELGIAYTSAIVQGTPYVEPAVTNQNKFSGQLRADRVRVARSNDPLLLEAKAAVEAEGIFNDSYVSVEYMKRVKDAGYDAILYNNGQLRIFTPQRVAPAFNRVVALNKYVNKAISYTKKNGGTTLNLMTGQEMGGTAYYSVSPYKRREKVVDELTTAELESFVLENEDLFEDPNHYLGTWFNEADGKVYLDVAVLTPDFNKARSLAKKHKQIAFFNLRTFEEIPTDTPQPEQTTLFRNVSQFDKLDTVYHNKGEQAIAELERILGTPKNLKIKIFTGSKDSPAGYYTKGQLKDVIALAENAQDIESVAAHEGFHFLETNVLSATDRAIIKRGLAPGSRLFKRLDEAALKYDQLNGTSVTDEIRGNEREAHAYAYEFWKRGELDARGPVERVFEMIRNLLDRISNALFGHGFRNSTDLFEMIDRGMYARREVQALRIEDQTESHWIDDIEPDAIPGLHRAGREKKKTKAPAGRPPDITSPQALAALRKKLKDLALEGAEGRFWHEESAEGIMRWSNGNVRQATILSKLIALFSPRTPVGGDFLHALKAIDQFNNGRPIRAGIFPNVMGERAAEVFAENESKTTIDGIKRNSFFRNMMFYIDPVTYSEDVQGATIDMWMHHAFGFRNTVSGAVTTAQYRWAEAEVGKLARELGWGIQEVQAAIWVSTKARWNTVRAQAVKKADKMGWRKPEMVKGVERKVFTKEGTKEFLKYWRDLALKTQPSENALADAMFNYGDAVLTVENAGLNTPTAIEGLPEQIQYTDDIIEEMEVDEVNISDLQEDQDIGAVSLQFYSKAALADLISMAKKGEAQTTQMYSVVGDLIDRAEIPQELSTAVLGNSIKNYTKGATSSVKRFYDEYISSGLQLARSSTGYKNVFRTLTGYTQRKNRLIADFVDNQLKTWRSGSSQRNIDRVSKVLLKRTMNGWKEGSPELRAQLESLDPIERKMFDEATNMVANGLRQEFEADKVSYAQALGIDSEEYKEWLETRGAQIDAMIEEGYFPERRYGDHGVHVYLEAGGKRITLAYELDTSRAVAENRVGQLKEVLKEFPDIKVEYGFKYRAEHDGSLSYQQFLDVAKREGILLSQAERERVAKALVAADSVRRNRIFRRKDVPGASGDGMRVLAEFAVTMSNKIGYAEFGAAIQDALGGRVVEVKFDTDGTPSVAVAEGSDTWGQDGEMSGFYRNLADKTADFVLAPKPGNKASTFLRGAATFQFLGGSLAAGAIQLTSLAMNTSPYLSQHTSYTDAVAKTAKALKIATTNTGVINDIAKILDKRNVIKGVDEVPGLRDALIRATQDGTNLDTEIYQIMGLTRGKMLAQSRGVQKALNGWMAPFRVTEQWNRISTFIAAYNVGRQNGLSGDALYDFSKTAVDNTQFRYDDPNRPGLARGPVGALLFTFKTYPIFMMELMTGLAKENKKAAVIMMLSLTAMAGIEGLPFVEDLEDLIDTIAQRVFGSSFNSKRAMRNVFKDASVFMTGVDLSGWFMHGIANQLTGLNFANRVGLGNLLPGSRMGAADADYKQVLQEIIGPAGAVAQGYLSGLDYVSRGEFNQAAKVALPLGLRNVVKGAEQFESGFAQDIGGRNIVPVSSWESFWQSVGFSSSALSSAYETDRIDRAQKAFYQQAKRSFTNDIVKAIRRGDKESIADTMEAVKGWNEMNPDLPITINSATVKKAVVLSGMTLDQRNYSLLPKALRAGAEVTEALRRDGL